MDQGTQIDNENKMSYYFCMSHSVLTCLISLPRTTHMFLLIAELCSGNENEVK